MASAEGGVSFWDVREAAQEVGRLFGCIVHFEMHLPMRKNTQHSWQVRCVARWYDTGGRVTKERGEGSPWPCGECRTFSGLELMLLHLLERKINDELMDEARAAIAQGRLF